MRNPLCPSSSPSGWTGLENKNSKNSKATVSVLYWYGNLASLPLGDVYRCSSELFIPALQVFTLRLHFQAIASVKCKCEVQVQVQ